MSPRSLGRSRWMVFSDVIAYGRPQTPWAANTKRQGCSASMSFWINFLVNRLVWSVTCNKCNPPHFLSERWPTHTSVYIHARSLTDVTGLSNLTGLTGFTIECLSLFLSSVLNLPHPSSKWLNHIYTTQLGRFLEKLDFTQEVRDACEDLVSTAMGLYFELTANLLPTPAKSHYTFNLRDLNKVSEFEHNIRLGWKLCQALP